MTSTKGMETTDAVKLILGLPTTKMKLKIEREGEPEPIIKELARDKVIVESVYGYKRNDEGRLLGLLHRSEEQDRLPLPDAVRPELRRGHGAGRQAAPQGRGQGRWSSTCGSTRAGSSTLAVNICDMFVDDGVIVSIRPGNSRDRRAA